MAREKHIQTFTNGVNTVLAPDLMESNTCESILNCNITSSADGNIGIVTHPKGNVQIPFELPEGENLCIGVAKDEESNKMYIAIWNSLGFHSWYQFDAVSETVKLIFQSITYTGNVDILKWEKGKLILHANVIDNNLLYWVIDGRPAMKFNIKKAIDLNDGGYGNVILEDYVKAVKKTLGIAPFAKYITNLDIPNNSVYRNLFKFTARYIYDDGEYSVFSDFSNVAIPDKEDITGSKGIPKINNGIALRLQTGGMLVNKIEIAMQKTDQNTGTVSDFVSIAVLDKAVLGIPDNSEYTYEFYNNNTYLALDQAKVLKQQPDFPREPKVQEYTSNRIVYGNFKLGFPAVKVDFSARVEYEELFVPDSTENVLNNPSLVFNLIRNFYEGGGFLSGGGWNYTVGTITVGPDVKSGNVFTVRFTNDDFQVSITATLSDDSKSIAAKIRSVFLNHPRINGSKDSYVRDLVPLAGGYTRFEFCLWNNWKKPAVGVITSVVPVNYSTLKDTGNSVLNEKLGSSCRYALRYEDDSDERSLAYGNTQVVSIKTINELGDIKKVSTILEINHEAPSWAKRYSIVRTKNLSQDDYIQILIQRIVEVSVSSVNETYHDVILGSLYTYQGVHPNSTLNFEFKKGDRIRLLKTIDNDVWSIPSASIEYEVMDYFKEVTHDVKENVSVDGTAVVKTSPDANNIGNNIIIDGVEREIIGITTDGYTLNSDLSINGSSASEIRIFPAYSIINRRGVLRIKMDPANPIVADGISKFSLVEIYKPTQTFSDNENENYYDIGYKFDIYEENGRFYHRGNNIDQDATNPASIKIGGIANYVRNRELITNNSITNPQVKFSSIEDQSYSDFYISNLSSYGRPTRLDDSRGEVLFDDRFVWSDAFIEDTKINGLNMFNSLNRVDYNDKYGSIQRIIFYEGRMYIFKYLKTGWVPVNGSIFTDTEGSPTVAISSRLLPDKMEYFLWEGGVGNNPESIVKEGNNIYGISPNSEVFFEIGGRGVMPISKMYGIDNRARALITGASKAGVNIVGATNRKNNRYVAMIPKYDRPAYADEFNNTNSRVDIVPDLGDYTLLTTPSNGIVSKNGDIFTYVPNINYSGIDYFSYKSGTVVRNASIVVLSEDTQLVWKPSGQFCVVSAGSRTGFVGYSLLLEYDNFSETYTGNTKPNVESDSDYIAPIENQSICPLGSEYFKMGVIERSINNQNILLKFTSLGKVKVEIREGIDYSGAVIIETDFVDSGEYSLLVPQSVSRASIYLISENADYGEITEISVKRAYFVSAAFSDLINLTSLELDQSYIPISYNLPFTSLDIVSNLLLEKLIVIHHKLNTVNLINNPLVTYLDVSYGVALTSLTIGDWNTIRVINIHGSAFTSDFYSPAFIDSLITTFNSNVPTDGAGYRLQYGENNGKGVKPSVYILPVYNALKAKGVTVVGRSPEVVTQTNLSMSSGSHGNSIEFTLFLDDVLSVDIVVRVRGSYMDPFDLSVLFAENVIISAGTDVFNGAIYASDPISSYNISIQSVTPNPAGGIQISY